VPITKRSPVVTSIVTVLYGKRALTERFLASLERELGPRLGADVELVLVDNASPDDTGALLDAWESRATVVRLPENRNFGGGNNAGAEAARGDVLVLLNNDAFPSAAALDALAGEARDPGVGAAGCLLLYADRTIQHAGMGWFRTGSGLVRPFHPFRHERETLPAARAVRDVDVVTGAALAIRRGLFLDLGGFRPQFVNGFEDTDLCLRIRSRGLRVVYRGDVSFVHEEGGTRGRNSDERQNEAHFDTAWQALLDDDADQLHDDFDACFNPRRCIYPGDHPWGTTVSVEGEIATLSPESAEARGLLAGLEAAGLGPAARQRLEGVVAPRLADAEWRAVAAAEARPRRPDAVVVSVGPGHADVLRLGRPADPCGRVVWAASKAVADEVVRRGGRAEVVPPFVGAVPAGAGGGGVLALDRPVASELAFAELAAAHDVVVCGDDDPFQRRALLAAATGAAVVAPAGGPAGDVLGDRLASCVDEALEQAGEREARRSAVRAATNTQFAELLARMPR
jgi:GT2 family glycosyltransferase